MINSANVTPLQARRDGIALIEIRLTHRARDLLVRAGLQETYLRHFMRDGGTTLIYGLTLEQIESLIPMLKPMRSEAQRYDKVAIDALERELKRVRFTERVKGLWPDPEPDIANVIVTLMLAHAPSPARFDVGDRAFESDVGEVTIVEPYGFYKALCSEGRFYDKDGDRIDYFWGYVVRNAGGHCYVICPHALSDAEGRPTHLKLLLRGDVFVPASGGIHD